jgi:hypothetical protein
MIHRISPRPSLVIVLVSLLGISGFLFHSSAVAAPPLVTSKIAGSLNDLTVPPLESLLNSNSQKAPKYAWKENIVGTIFWVGEEATEKNPVPNNASSWDPKWQQSFGGFDNPDSKARGSDYLAVGFVPKENPYYVALPYNDVINYKTTKEEAAKVIPWFKDTFTRHGKSVCHNRWIAIRYKGKTCYAQWSDCGPFLTTDAEYVFGNARPSTTKNNGAGIDLAPAVRDFLGFASGKTCDWRFVEESEVPDGPWKTYGRNNPFSRSADKTLAMASRPAQPVEFKPVPGSATPASASSRGKVMTIASSDSNTESVSARLDELKRQRDLWLKQGGRTAAR